MTVRRCLVLRALGLGDFLTGVPALRALRRALPGWEIVLAAPPALSPLVDRCSAVDRLLPTGELEPVAWEGPPPELAVDLHGNGPASKDLLVALGPRRLLAFAGPSGDGRRWDGPPWIAGEHEVRRWCRLVGDGLGVASDPTDLRLDRPRAIEQPAVVVHPGAASGSRRWPPERFAQVARWAAEHVGAVVVTGSAAEVPIADRVRRLADLHPAALLAGRTDLAGLASVVSVAPLVVCGDTGVAHLATAFGRPSVVLFGPVPPAEWGPPAGGPHAALWHGRLGERGDPHGDTVDPRLAAITVDEVVRAAGTLVGRGASDFPRDVARPALP